MSAPSSPTLPTLPIPALPISQLESLKFKTTQIIESIQALQRVLDGSMYPGANMNAMPAWPDILAKYNLLLSQTHNLSNALVSPIPQGQAVRTISAADNAGTAGNNPFAKIALHPALGMPDAQLDNDLIPLLRNQQTTEVLRVESDTVRRLSQRLAALPPSALPMSLATTTPFAVKNASSSAQALKDDARIVEVCAAIKTDHDARCIRAVRAVAMLKDKYEWHARVAVETAEPEDWVPPPMMPQDGDGDGDVAMDSADDAAVGAQGEGDEGDSGDEEEELEEVLGPTIGTSPVADAGPVDAVQAP